MTFAEKITVAIAVVLFVVGAFLNHVHSAGLNDDYGRVAIQAAQCFVADNEGGACRIEPRPATCEINLWERWGAIFKRQCSKDTK